jgi:hypothetical protein
MCRACRKQQTVSGIGRYLVTLKVNYWFEAKQQYLAYFYRYLSSKYECIHHIMKKQAIGVLFGIFIDTIECK